MRYKEVDMDISFVLARIIGITMTILYAGAIINFKFLQRSVQTIEEQPILLYLAGFIALTLGVLVIEFHNLWVWDWRVIITVLGWLLLIDGSMGLLMPGAAQRVGRALLVRNANLAFLECILMLFVGLYLSVMGFWGL